MSRKMQPLIDESRRNLAELARELTELQTTTADEKRLDELARLIAKEALRLQALQTIQPIGDKTNEAIEDILPQIEKTLDSLTASAHSMFKTSRGRVSSALDAISEFFKETEPLENLDAKTQTAMQLLQTVQEFLEREQDSLALDAITKALPQTGDAPLMLLLMRTCIANKNPNLAISIIKAQL